LGKRLDLTDVKYGRLTGVRYVRTVKHICIWLFKCDCGNLTEAEARGVKAGNTLSCGCLKSEGSRERRTTHGMSTDLTYKSWTHMQQRCFNPKATKYEIYGGRGITVCKRWCRFENFLEDMGERPSRLHSIDRIDGNGHYEPGNCRWATTRQQGNNTSRNVFLEFAGKRQTLAQWSTELGLGYDRLRRRIDCGWSVEKALTTPKRKFVRKLDAAG